MKIFYFILTFLILFLLTGCADKPTETTTLGSVHGTVFDQSNNSELSGVTISIQNIGNRTTNNLGYYEFLDLAENTYTIIAEKTGYVTETAQVEIEANTNKEVNFILHAALPAQLLVTPTNLNFGQTVYNLNLAVNNGGDEELSWQVTSDQSWLTTFPTTGSTTTEEDQIKVTVNRAALEVGNYTGNLSFTSNGGNFNVPVQMEVTPIVLIVNPTSLDFGEEETELTFEISNTGNETLNWSLSPNQNWISANPTSGSLTNDSEIVTVNVDRSGISPDTYNGSISITSNGGNQDVNISMIVPEGPAPILEVNTTSLDFGDNLSNLSFTISNTGDDILNWNISDNQTWISVSQTNGTTNPSGSNNINVTVDRTGLANGTHTGEINITSDGGDHTIDVSMNVTPAQLIVNPTSLDFGEEETSLNLTIENSGFEMMNWSLTSNQNWLIANPTSGSLTNSSEDITVNVDRAGLEPDTYEGSILVESNAGNQNVSITMIVPEGPSPYLEVNPNSLDFGSTESNLTFTITNSGDEILNWNISDNQDWINVIPTGGTTNPQNNEIIFVSVDRTGLSFGSYNGSVSITSDGGNESVSISMTVEPELVVSTNLLNFGLTNEQLTFNITNNGQGVLTWSINDNQNWITVSPESGTTTTETDIIQVNVDRTGLNPGDYSGTVTVQSDGGNEQITVNMSVPNPPILIVDPTNLDFGATINQLSFEIQNVGDATLNWDISDNQDWLYCYPTSGSTNPSGTTTINVSVDRTGLSFGSYNGSVSITSDGGNEDVSIYMTVPFFDGFENFNNWNNSGWEISDYYNYVLDPPSAKWSTSNSGWENNYLKMNIDVVSGQSISFVNYISFGGDGTYLKLFINNVLIWETNGNGTCTPNINISSTGNVEIKIVASTNVPNATMYIDNFLIE